MTLPELILGHVGPYVGQLQDRLNQAGFPVQVDNDFGPKTLAAVLAFQQAKGLKVDGEVGKNTWAALPQPHTTPDPQLTAAQASLRAEITAALTGGPSLNERTAVLLRAAKDLGKRETPLGSNRGPEIDHLEPAGAPWCASAVCSWVKLGLGHTTWAQTPMGSKLAKVLRPPEASLEGWALKRGILVQESIPGAIMIMGRAGSSSDKASGSNPGHCGLFIRADGTRRVTLDGNVSDRVVRVSRERAALVGFIEWWRV